MINKKNNYNKFFIVNRKMTYDPENYEHLYKIIIIGDSAGLENQIFYVDIYIMNLNMTQKVL